LLPREPAPAVDANEVDELLRIVTAEPGNPYRGKQHYLTRCASCHVFFDRGRNVGPDLTPLQRNDLPSLLHHIVAPSAEIREGYEHLLVTRKDGRVLSGFSPAPAARPLQLRDLNRQTHRLADADLRSVQVLEQSLMPPGLLAGLDKQQLRDFIAYLRIGQPISKD